MEHTENTPEENAEIDRAIACGYRTLEMPAPKCTYGKLAELPTRVLLAMKDDLHHGYTDTVSWYRPETATTSRIFQGTAEQILEELAKRPHVMNKAESKVMRKLQAQSGMSEHQIRQIPKYKTMLAEASGTLIKVNSRKFELYRRFGPGSPRTSGWRNMSVKP